MGKEPSCHQIDPGLPTFDRASDFKGIPQVLLDVKQTTATNWVCLLLLSAWCYCHVAGCCNQPVFYPNLLLLGRQWGCKAKPIFWHYRSSPAYWPRPGVTANHCYHQPMTYCYCQVGVRANRSRQTGCIWLSYRPPLLSTSVCQYCYHPTITYAKPVLHSK
ncbi:hypothetical protein CEXT_748001 [Caerostris extrusa]|uniref:Uncharacterized protein n=1 Tax=Caerostris extrusa TaxID=172846 RepID=A0AAV4T7G3_CAEEX|nr:hypothetical protein CEXT_748001 [Caerostris extrusa]